MSRNFKPWLLLGVIFVVGVVTGGALTIGWQAHERAAFNLDNRHPGAGPGQGMRQGWMAHLTKRLNLSADQQAKIQPIVDDADAKLQAVLHDEKQRGSQIFKDADDQISAFLTPDQKAELEKMRAERDKMFPGHMHGPGGKFNHDGRDDSMPPPPPVPSPQDGATNAAPVPPESPK